MGALHLITGGSGSGKSAFAERLVMEAASSRSLQGLSSEKIYLASMHRDSSREFQKRLRRHLALRAGKGFVTWEQETCLPSLLPRIRSDHIILLEDLPNLLANETYGQNGCLSPDAFDEYALTEGIIRPLLAITKKSACLAVVTGEIFTDDPPQDSSTRLYIRSLAFLNTALARAADTFTEVVCGIPVNL